MMTKVKLAAHEPSPEPTTQSTDSHDTLDGVDDADSTKPHRRSLTEQPATPASYLLFILYTS